MDFITYITGNDTTTIKAEVMRVLKEGYLNSNPFQNFESEVMDSDLADIIKASIAQTLVTYNETAPDNLKIIVSQELIEITYTNVKVNILVYVIPLSDINNPDPSVGIIQF